jgi:hypothetical protein
VDKSDQDSFASPKEPRRPPLAGYANYFEVGHNAFEFLLDAGQIEPQSGTIRFTDRIAITPVNAKLLSELLARSITQFESAHGPIPDLAELQDDAVTLTCPSEFEARALAARRRNASSFAAGSSDAPVSHER